MIIKPMIGDWEVPNIARIATLEERRIARLAVPGLSGDIQQDLGASSLRVEIVGSLVGDEARGTFLDSLRGKFEAAEPVAFVADIARATELDQVLIEELACSERNEWADSFNYRIVLRQYVEPPEPPAPLDDLGLDLEPDLDLLAALGLEGLELPNLLGDLPTLGDPVAPLKPALDGVRAATAGLRDQLASFKELFA